MSVITGSSSSYSLRSVNQPSTTRNTSPNGSPPGMPAPSPAEALRPALAVRAHRVDAEIGEPLLALGEQGGDLADRPAYAHRVQPAGHPDQCGRSFSVASEPPPKSRQ
jgi:hypothetical protein